MKSKQIIYIFNLVRCTLFIVLIVTVYTYWTLYWSYDHMALYKCVYYYYYLWCMSVASTTGPLLLFQYILDTFVVASPWIWVNRGWSAYFGKRHDRIQNCRGASWRHHDVILIRMAVVAQYTNYFIVYCATNAAHKIHTITISKNRNRSIPFIT